MDIVDSRGIVLCTILNFTEFTEGLSFLGRKSDSIQVANFRYNRGKILRDHKHIGRERTIYRTQEVMIVMKGACFARIFDTDDKLVEHKHLVAGDICISYRGGIGFDILQDDTYLIEVKSGDYLVNNDDEDRVRI